MFIYGNLYYNRAGDLARCQGAIKGGNHYGCFPIHHLRLDAYYMVFSNGKWCLEDHYLDIIKPYENLLDLCHAKEYNEERNGRN